MNTIEDFKNAPFAATATRDDGLLAIKIGDGERRWLTPLGTYLYDDELAILDYTLHAPAPTTAREALDLAWELAHEAKEGQVVPKGTRFLEVTGTGLKEYTAQTDFKSSPEFAHIRTFNPLPDPEPDWLDAPAVIATTIGNDNHRTFMNVGNSRWRTIGEKSYHWNELTDVTPLYPKEVQDA